MGLSKRGVVKVNAEWTADLALRDGKVAFPDLSTSLVRLIGIGHVGYLTVKSAPKTATT